MAHTEIAWLMAIPHQHRTIQWLHRMLRSAIRLELATIPPYLSAYWSIEDVQGSPPGYVKQQLQRILSEEMAHLGLACNLLSAFQAPSARANRDLPTLNSPDMVPVYPGPLPGGVHPGLHVHLSKLSKDQIGTQFMQIEFPSPESVHSFKGWSYPTIGAFYAEIRKHIDNCSLPVCQEYQVESARNFVFRIRSKSDAIRAIDTIASEGEGALGSPFVEGGSGNTQLAHYYQFAEFFWQRKIVPCGTDGWGFCGDRIEWPQSILDMAVVPPGGYHTHDAFAFDHAYSHILSRLTLAWHTRDENQADTIAQDAITLMQDTAPGSLQYLAKKLMATPLPFARGHYGPCFRLI